MGGFFDIFTILLGCYGIYFLYLWFCTVVLKKPLNTKNLLPTDLNMKSCNDPEKFLSVALPWVFITGLSLIAYAAASYFLGSQPWFIAVVFAYFAAMVAYYVITMRIIRRRFWPDTVKEKKSRK